MEITKHRICICFFLEHKWEKVIDTVPTFLLRRCARCGLEIDKRDDFETYANRVLGEN